VQDPVWMGTSCHATCFPVVCIALFRDTFASNIYAVNFFQRDNSEYTIHVFWPDSLTDPDDDLSEEWNFTVPREKLRFSGDSRWEVRSGTLMLLSSSFRLERLLDLCPVLQRKRYIRRDPLIEWMDDSGRIILMGAAAHPSLVRSYAF
jgi:salicylate hydroxylase